MYSNKKKILIADDEVVILKVMCEELISAGYAVDTACDGEDACYKFSKNIYDLVILDNKMPKKNGLDVLKHIKKQDPAVTVIMMTAFGTISHAVEAMKHGAYDYITKPFDNDDFVEKVKRVIKIKDSMSPKFYSANEDDELVGQSKAIEEIRKKIAKIKDLDTTILLTGESGTGKGIIARDIHYLSHRKQSPFVHVNCAVLPENLIDSELFGHEKGAFTGANESKKGKFEIAAEGTIFLDEITSLDHSLQAKLLTALQEKRFEKIGSNKTVKLNARIIAATNANLEEAVRANRFREDLYYRLNVITIECPPLRYRKDDIKVLTDHFIKVFNRRLHKQITDISVGVWHVLTHYNWPGNVRELQNTIESSMALSSDNTLKETDLPLRIRKKVCESQVSEEQADCSILEVEEIKAIKKALARNKGHRENTAKELSVSRRTLQYKLKKFGLL